MFVNLSSLLYVNSCLAIPGKIMSINDNMAQVNVAGIVKTASLQLVDNARVGDYIILHAGFAIQRLDEDEALETLKMWKFIDGQTANF
ncbi:HypC/HybG/HupF family hydrogenase formation chaperone [Candidatus Poribacteria bacterium]|nr:HypC/HybG/HupF family hydrogenase formation chaperone [Candidatus Poribacteria bacterium]